MTPTPTPTPVAVPPISPIEVGRTAFVDSLYLDVLGRFSDEGGGESWVAALDSGMKATDVLAAFFHSTERLTLQHHHQAPTMSAGQALTAALHAERIAGDPVTTPADPSEVALVTSLYRQILGRTPDLGGLDHWLDSLDSGTTSAAVAQSLYGSTEAKKLRARHKAPKISESKALAVATKAAKNAVQIGTKTPAGILA